MAGKNWKDCHSTLCSQGVNNGYVIAFSRFPEKEANQKEEVHERTRYVVVETQEPLRSLNFFLVANTSYCMCPSESEASSSTTNDAVKSNSHAPEAATSPDNSKKRKREEDIDSVATASSPPVKKFKTASGERKVHEGSYNQFLCGKKSAELRFGIIVSGLTSNAHLYQFIAIV